MDFRSGIASFGLEKPDAYNPYAAGPKVYGAAGVGTPNSGPMTNADQRMGYKKRELAADSKRDAFLSRIRANQQQNYMSADWLGGQQLR